MTRFTELHLLRAFSREVLQEFFDRFDSELKEGGIELPATSLPDDGYLRGLPPFNDRVPAQPAAVSEISKAATTATSVPSSHTSGLQGLP